MLDYDMDALRLLRFGLCDPLILFKLDPVLTAQRAEAEIQVADQCGLQALVERLIQSSILVMLHVFKYSS